MKKVFTSFATFMTIFTSAHAADLDCTISINYEPVSQVTVTTKIGEKTLIDRVDGISAYITQRTENFFSLEAFIANYEIRGYSEGMLSGPSDKLNFSLWERTAITDISCAFAQK